MALSSKDAAAVKKVGISGGLSGSQATSISKGAVVAPSSSNIPTTPGSYGIDKKTGLAVGPENDAKGSAAVKATPAGVAPQGSPEVPVTAPANAQVPMAQQQGLPPGRTASGITTDPVSGQQFQIGKSGVYEKYQQGLANLQQNGGQAPAQRGEALGAVAGAIPKTDNTTAVDDYISQDPNVNSLMQGITQLLNPQKQTSTLLQDYEKLKKESGLDKINAEMIDAETVINGTEDDIRREITTAGGFGTDSQVQALALSRNKSLLTRYNQLVQMKTDATNQLNTLSSLNSQDKQIAQQRLSTQISAMFNLANFQQQAQNNVREAFNSMVSKIGYAGAYAAYSTDPNQLAYIEKIANLGPGGLQKLSAMPDYDMQSKQLDVQYKKAQIANTYSEINARNNAAKADTLNGKPQTAVQSQVQGYADRTSQADQTINSFGSKFTGSFANLSGYLPNFLKSSDRQQYEQAERNFVNAVLRRESGAAISPSEFDSAASQYFPQAGDQQAVVAQKAQNRQTTINNLYQQSNIQRGALPGQVVESDGKQYKVGEDGETLTPI